MLFYTEILSLETLALPMWINAFILFFLLYIFTTLTSRHLTLSVTGLLIIPGIKTQPDEAAQVWNKRLRLFCHLFTIAF